METQALDYSGFILVMLEQCTVMHLSFSNEN